MQRKNKMKTALILGLVIVLAAGGMVLWTVLPTVHFEGVVLSVAAEEPEAETVEYILCIDTTGYSDMGQYYIRLTEDSNVRNSGGSRLPAEGLEVGDVVTVTLKKSQLNEKICRVKKVVFQYNIKI